MASSSSESMIPVLTTALSATPTATESSSISSTAAKPSSDTQIPVGVFVGGVVGGIGGITLIALAIFYLLRRRKRHIRISELANIEPLPFPPQPRASMPIRKPFSTPERAMQEGVGNASSRSGDGSDRVSSDFSTSIIRSDRDRWDQRDEDLRGRMDLIQVEIARLHHTMRMQQVAMLSETAEEPPAYQSAYDISEG
jgi:hypothetical protein